MNENTVYVGLDTDTGEMFVITEWTIETTSATEVLQIQRQIASVDQEINYLVKLRHHNLGHYVAFKHETVDNKFIVKTLAEFVRGVHCLTLLIALLSWRM